MVALKPARRWISKTILPRSRNAVVALKLENSNPTAPYRNTKQERRGGIETTKRIFKSLLEEQEAGTPWWH